MDTSKRADVLPHFSFWQNCCPSIYFFVHGWEFILRESVYYGQKEQFYLIPFLCPVWNIAADYFRPITFSVPGTEVMVEKILSIGQQAGAGLVTRALPFSLTIFTIMPRPCIVTSVTNWTGVLVGKSISISEKKLSGREANLGLVRLSNAEPKIEKIIWFNFLVSCSQFSHVRAGARDPIKS